MKLKVFNRCSVPGSKKRGNIQNFAQTCTAHLLRTVPGSSRGRGGRRFLCAHLLQPAGDSVPFFGALVSAQVLYILYILCILYIFTRWWPAVEMSLRPDNLDGWGSNGGIHRSGLQFIGSVPICQEHWGTDYQ